MNRKPILGTGSIAFMVATTLVAVGAALGYAWLLWGMPSSDKAGGFASLGVPLAALGWGAALLIRHPLSAYLQSVLAASGGVRLPVPPRVFAAYRYLGMLQSLLYIALFWMFFVDTVLRAT